MAKRATSLGPKPSLFDFVFCLFVLFCFLFVCLFFCFLVFAFARQKPVFPHKRAFLCILSVSPFVSL